MGVSTAKILSYTRQDFFIKSNVPLRNGSHAFLLPQATQYNYFNHPAYTGIISSVFFAHTQWCLAKHLGNLYHF